MMLTQQTKENCPEVVEMLNCPPPFYVRYGTIITISCIFFIIFVSKFVYVPSELTFDTEFTTKNDTFSLRSKGTRDNVSVILVIDEHIAQLNLTTAQLEKLQLDQDRVTVKIASYPVTFRIWPSSKDSGRVVIRLINTDTQPVFVANHVKEKITICFPKRTLFENVIKNYKSHY